MSEFVKVVDVSKTYGSGRTEVQALKSASMELDQGEFVSLVGPSGSGKTTVLSIVGGLLKPTSGEVSIAGNRIDSMSAGALTRFRAKHIGFVFQGSNLVPFLTAHENVTYASTLLGRSDGMSRKEAKARASALLDELGLADRSGALPTEMSGGERQRVAIARALMNDPDLILVDEPTAALDTERGREVVEMLAREVKQRGKTAVMVTHDMRMTGFTDRVITMLDGVVEKESIPASH